MALKANFLHINSAPSSAQARPQRAIKSMTRPLIATRRDAIPAGLLCRVRHSEARQAATVRGLRQCAPVLLPTPAKEPIEAGTVGARGTELILLIWRSVRLNCMAVSTGLLFQERLVTEVPDAAGSGRPSGHSNLVAKERQRVNHSPVAPSIRGYRVKEGWTSRRSGDPPRDGTFGIRACKVA
jgi:hypothetical protein